MRNGKGIDFRFDYDYDEDSLYVYCKDVKAKGSIEFTDFSIDYDNSGRLSGIEFGNASSFFSKMQSKRIQKKELSGLRDVKLRVDEGRDTINIFMQLEFQNDRLSQCITIPSVKSVSVPA